MASLSRSFIVAGFLFTLVQGQKCYDTLGVANDDLPCDKNAGTDPTFCCPLGMNCMSYGLCQKQGLLGQGSCTEQSWGVDAPDACFSKCSSTSGGFVALSQCLPVSLAMFVCGGDDSACHDQSNQIHLNGVGTQASTIPHLVATKTPSTSAKPSSAEAAAPTTTTSEPSPTKSAKETSAFTSTEASTTSGTDSAATTKPAGDQASGTPTVSSDTAGSQSSSSTSAVPSSTSTEAAGGGMSQAKKISIGVGIAVSVAFVALVGSLAMFFLRRGRQKKEQEVRNEELRAKEAARLNVANDGLQSKSGFSGGIAEVPDSQTNWGAPPLGYAKSPEVAEYKGVPQSQQYQQPLPPSAGYSVPPPQPQRHHQPYQSPPTHMHEMEHNPAPQQQPHSVSPQATHSELSSDYNTYQSTLPPPSAAQELAAARMRSNVSPMPGTGAESLGNGTGDGHEMP